MKVSIKIFKGQRWNDEFVEGQLLIVQGIPCIIPLDNHIPGHPFENCIEWDGHHLRQEVDSPLWVKADSVEFVRTIKMEIQ
jgi:hypothetical protein